MMEHFRTIAALNAAFVMGMIARLHGEPVTPPSWFDELHKSEWKRGWKEAKGD